MTNLNLSPEAQTCFEQVQKAPDNQKQSTFERACQLIKDKTQIALLATMLGLGLSQAPEVQAGEPQGTETTQADSVVNNPEYKKLLATIESEFPKLVAQGKNEVSPENQAKFENWMGSMEKKLRDGTIALKSVSMFERMVDKNGPFYTNFHNYVAQFEPFAEIRTAERMVTIAQNRETIAQNRETIAQLEKNMALLDALSKAGDK